MIYMIGLSLLLGACQTTNDEPKDEVTANEKTTENATTNLTGEDLFDIYLLFKAPQTDEMKDLSKVIKIVFTENNSSTEHTLALDIDRQVIHLDPWTSGSGILSEDEKNVQGLEDALTILKKYNVQEWKDNYTYEDPASYEDGYGWSLWLQFSDGTVEKHYGSGSFKKEIIPENFNEFVDELNQFVETILEKDKLAK